MRESRLLACNRGRAKSHEEGAAQLILNPMKIAVINNKISSKLALSK